MPLTGTKGNVASATLLRFASDAIPALVGPAASKAAAASINPSSIRPPKSSKALSKLGTITSGTSLVPPPATGLLDNSEKVKKDKLQPDTPRKKTEVKGCTKMIVKEGSDGGLDVSKGHLASLPERGEPDGQEAHPQTAGKANSSKDTLKAKKEQNRRGLREKSVSNADDVGGMVNTNAAEGQVQRPQGKKKSAVPAEISRKVSQEYIYEDIDACIDNKINKKIGTKLTEHTNNIRNDEPQNLLANSSESLLVHLGCGTQSGVKADTESNKQQLPPKKELPRKSREGKEQRPDVVGGGHTGGPLHNHHRSQQNMEVVTAPTTEFAVPPDTVHSTGPDSLTKMKTKMHSEVKRESPLPCCTAKNIDNIGKYHFGEVFEASPKQRAASFSHPKCLEQHRSTTSQGLRRRNSRSLSITKNTEREEKAKDLNINLTHCKKRIPTPKPKSSFQLSIKTPLGNLELSGGRSCCKSCHFCSSGSGHSRQDARLTSSSSSAVSGKCRASPNRTVHRKHSLSPPVRSQRNLQSTVVIVDSDQRTQDKDVLNCRKKGEVPNRHGGGQRGHDSTTEPCIIICESPSPHKPLMSVPAMSAAQPMNGGEEEFVVLSPPPNSFPQNHRSRQGKKSHVTIN